MSQPSRVSESLPIIIIGSGLAGYNLVKELRKSSAHQSIAVYSADDGSFYSKPQLSTAFSKNKTANELVSHTAEQMAQQYDIEIVTFCRVSDIEPQNSAIVLADGSKRHYSQLVLATGADCVSLQVAGDGASQVYHINDLQDYHRFRTLAQRHQRVLIMGAGLIGCEYANDLIGGGFKVQLVDPQPSVLTNLLPDRAAECLVRTFNEQQVDMYFNNKVTHIKNTLNGLTVTLSDGQSVNTDIVLSAAGVWPNTTLAKRAKLDCNKGIATDRFGRTSVNNIFAVGDCAEICGLNLVYILPLMAQVKAVSQTLLGNETAIKYGTMPIAIKTTLHPIVVNPPPSGVSGKWQIIVEDKAGVQAHFLDDQGSILGYALTGNQIRFNYALAKQCPALMK